MKVKTKTIKGWASDTNYMFSQNVRGDTFSKNLAKYVKENLRGFKRLKSFQYLKGKNASEKVIIKAWYWRGNWSDPIKKTYCIFYK